MVPGLGGFRVTVLFMPGTFIVGLKLASQGGNLALCSPSPIGDEEQGVYRLSHLLNLENVDPVPGQKSLSTNCAHEWMHVVNVVGMTTHQHTIRVGITRSID